MDNTAAWAMMGCFRDKHPLTCLVLSCTTCIDGATVYHKILSRSTDDNIESMCWNSLKKLTRSFVEPKSRQKLKYVTTLYVTKLLVEWTIRTTLIHALCLVKRNKFIHDREKTNIPWINLVLGQWPFGSIDKMKVMFKKPAEKYFHNTVHE